jgi:uncharacterized protein
VFTTLLLLAACAAGAVAAVAGFGIGSIVTPVLAIQTGTKLAVAAVSIPHLAATAVRFWMLREHVDVKVLRSFGLLSAAGGLAGALLHSAASSPQLTIVFAGLLIFAGMGGLTGLAERMRFGHREAWMAGALSGTFGGMVGNQGGIRSAALLGFGLGPRSFVATATATALIVDAARMPVYLATEGQALLAMWPAIALMTVAALAGTLLGTAVLRHVPAVLFRRIISSLILALGLFMLWQGIQRAV